MNEQLLDALRALRKIERWFGEFPETGKMLQDGTVISYGFQLGSNGERDFMRGVAASAARKIEKELGL